jgi:peptide/nickel transport system permease protein
MMIFIFSRLMPGDPVKMVLGDYAPEWIIDEMRDQMHLNDPVHVQYYYWLKGLIKGDLGKSLTTQRKVNDDIKEFFPASLELALYSGILMLFFATILGTISGWYANTWFDSCFRIIAYIGVVTPPFVFAILFVLVFGYFFNILPILGRLSRGIVVPKTVTGLYTIDALIVRDYAIFIDAIKHLILPVLSLMLGPMSQIARIIRASILDNRNKDYIIAAQSHGIPKKTIMFKYLLKPSFIPGISMAGLSFANLIANAFLIELIFNWPGLSRYGMTAMLRKDLNSIIIVTMLMSLLFLIMNAVVDIVVNILDPRIELGTK